MRRISAGLRPAILDILGLQAAIKWQSEDFTKRTGIPCELRARLDDMQLDDGLATAVFRIFQEALTNITRHANASQVTVDLSLDGSMIVLEVADDGVGLPAGGSRGRSLGLLGMGERARRLGGDCVVTPREPTGTLVSLRVPHALGPVRLRWTIGPTHPHRAAEDPIDRSSVTRLPGAWREGPAVFGPGCLTTGRELLTACAARPDFCS